MPKFSALAITRFFEADANAGRVARQPHSVVHVEADDGSWCELDADSRDHAKRLAVNWVNVHNARGASCREYDRKTGRLKRNPFFTHFPEVDFAD
jgi:hypothetical protein